MEAKEKYRCAGRLHSYVRDWRGDILNNAACIEQDIALVIAKYFCQDAKRNFFFSEVATSHFFSFRSKAVILGKILKKDFQFFIESNPDLLNQLDKVITFRNTIAHCTLDISDEALSRDPKEGVGFIKYTNGSKKTEVYSESDLNEWSGRMGGVSSDLETLKNIMGIKEEI